MSVSVWEVRCALCGLLSWRPSRAIPRSVYSARPGWVCGPPSACRIRTLLLYLWIRRARGAPRTPHRPRRSGLCCDPRCRRVRCRRLVGGVSRCEFALGDRSPGSLAGFEKSHSPLYEAPAFPLPGVVLVSGAFDRAAGHRCADGFGEDTDLVTEQGSSTSSNRSSGRCVALRSIVRFVAGDVSSVLCPPLPTSLPSFVDYVCSCDLWG